MSPQIGFVGLGNIGMPMALSLARSHAGVGVFDLRDAAVARLEEVGSVRRSSAADVAAQADITGVCVVNDQQVRDVFLSADGVLAGAREGSILVIHSTILPSTVRFLFEAAAAKGVRVLDAQVSGGDLRAADGTLAVMVGGEDEAFQDAQPYLAALGTTIRHMGPTGAGAAAKLALQGMTFTNQLAALEAVRFASLNGITEEALMELASATTGESFMTRNWGHFDRLLVTHTLARTEDLYRFFDKDVLALVLAAREDALSLPIAALACELLGPSFKERLADLDARVPA